jgi:hypothetical protein
MPRKQLQKGFPLMRHWHKAAWALLAIPVCAFGFDSVDVLTPAMSGLYPAYPQDPTPPYTVWGQAGLMYDSNLLRRPTGDNADFVTRLGVGGRLDQRVIGRQYVHLEGRLDGYLYDKFNEHDNVGYAALGEWRFQVGNDLAGAFTASRRRYQVNIAESQSATYDPINETTLGTNARYAIGLNLGLRGALNYVEYERPLHDFFDTKTVTGAAALEYISALGNTIGVEVQQTQGNAPVPETVDPLHLLVNNDFKQHDVGVVGAFALGPTLRLGGRVGRTTRHYTELANRDFSGPTWNVAVQWLPTAKTVLAVESAKFISSVIDIGASHMVSRGWALGPGWAVTAKLNLQARVFRQHQDFEGDPAAALGVAPVRQEVVRGYRLGAYWEYDRRWHCQFSLEHGDRESNTDGRAYGYSAGIAQIKYVF